MDEIDRNSMRIHKRVVLRKTIFLIAGTSMDTAAKLIHKICYPQATWTIDEAERHAKSLGARGIIRRKICSGGVVGVTADMLDGANVIQWTENLLKEK